MKNKSKTKPSITKSNNPKFTNKRISSKKHKHIGKLKSVPRVQKIDEYNDEGEDMLEMIETADLDFLKNAVINRSYNILNKIRYSE